MIRAFSRPVTHLAALEACTRVATKLCKSASATGDLHADFVAHKKAFVILCNTLFGRFTAVKFHESVPYFQFDIDNVSYFFRNNFEGPLDECFLVSRRCKPYLA